MEHFRSFRVIDKPLSTNYYIYLKHGLLSFFMLLLNLIDKLLHIMHNIIYTERNDRS
jgi:hypothetical protein